MLLSFADLACSALLRLLVSGRGSESLRTSSCSCCDISWWCSAGKNGGPRCAQPIVLSLPRRRESCRSHADAA
jgi:hypothetical protein